MSRVFSEELVNSVAKEMKVADLANATIGDVLLVASRLEELTGIPFIRMDQGSPGLPANKIGIEAEKKALDRGVEGQVLVEFVIDRDGSVCDVKPKHRIDPLLDDEAVRAVKNMPKWKPGTKDGKNVRIKYILPVSFRLQK